MLDNLNSKQKKIVVIVGIIVVIGIIYFIYNKNENKDIEIDEEILIENNKTEDEINNEETNEIVIHITGEVNNPGIIKLKEGSRIEDAIEKAGGLTENADISNVNLAYILDDGIKIKIPSSLDNKDMEDDEIITEENGENIIENIASSSSVNSSKININKATEEELKNLPGIGLELAARVVKYRTENGKFSNIEEIKNVSGIGDSKFEKIKELISVK